MPGKIVAVDTLAYLFGNDIDSTNKHYRLKVLRGATKFLSWNGRSFRRQDTLACLVPLVGVRHKILKTIHVDLEH